MPDTELNLLVRSCASGDTAGLSSSGRMFPPALSFGAPVPLSCWLLPTCCLTSTKTMSLFCRCVIAGLRQLGWQGRSGVMYVAGNRTPCNATVKDQSSGPVMGPGPVRVSYVMSIVSEVAYRMCAGRGARGQYAVGPARHAGVSVQQTRIGCC